MSKVQSVPSTIDLLYSIFDLQNSLDIRLVTWLCRVMQKQTALPS